MSNVKDTNIFDIQASEPYLTPEGEKRYRAYVNLRLHVLTDNLERAVELFKAVYPDAQLHQIIKRSSVAKVIVDSAIYGSFTQHNAVGDVVFQAEPEVRP
jgi:hypothetical protein